MKTISIVCLLSLCSLAVSKTLNLEELSSAITKHNEQQEARITSLAGFDKLYPQIEGALSANQYMAMYNLTRKQFIIRVFGNVYHLPIENLSSAVSEWNKQQTEGNLNMTSIIKYNTHCSLIHGAFSTDVYQILYNINQVEFIKKVFGNQEHFLSLEKLLQAVGEYNSKSPANTGIYTYKTYMHQYTQIEGALSPETYRLLYNMENINEFIKILFSNIEHLTPQELPQAIENYHHQVKFSKITSLSSFKRYRSNIPGGALSFEIYALLYGVTQEDFENMLIKASGIKSLTAEEIEEHQNSKQKPESELQPAHTNNRNTSVLLTLEQTPQAIVEYNKRKTRENSISVEVISSWIDYTNYYGQIPGADSIENLERQYKKKYGTLRDFTTFLLQKTEKTLTPIELSRAIADYNSTAHSNEKIDYVEDYEIFYYRIPHAPTIEIFKTAITKQFVQKKWNDLLRNKFGTIDNYIEFMLTGKHCELALAN